MWIRFANSYTGQRLLRPRNTGRTDGSIRNTANTRFYSCIFRGVPTDGLRCPLDDRIGSPTGNTWPEGSDGVSAILFAMSVTGIIMVSQGTFCGEELIWRRR